MDVSSGCVHFYLNGRDLGVVYPLNLVQFRKLADIKERLASITLSFIIRKSLLEAAIRVHEGGL
jgi:hypothetical protein